ncbi:oxidoreductase [bacterium]|nr:oxidoreductase [bacterium]
MSTHLFTPLRLREVALRNRIAVSPMCQYSSTEGLANDWHLVHLGSRAAGGAGLVIAEAAAVVPEGRISPADLGLWSDDHVEPLARCFRFVADQGAVPGIQLAHAGRKASTAVPWAGRGPVGAADGGWDEIVAPSALAFDEGHPVPRALDADELPELVDAFAAAARRALAAGAEVVEIHAAHGYLLHTFLSPLTNRRDDAHGGDFAGRTRLLREVVSGVRSVWPERLPLLVRISASDWIEGGWTADDSVRLAGDLAPLGVDLVDCSSGGLRGGVAIPVEPGYQVPFAARVRREAGMASGAVGLISSADQAEAIVAGGEADLVLLARQLLRDPHWPLHAARQLGAEAPVPLQYLRAFD